MSFKAYKRVFMKGKEGKHKKMKEFHGERGKKMKVNDDFCSSIFLMKTTDFHN